VTPDDFRAVCLPNAQTCSGAGLWIFFVGAQQFLERVLLKLCLEMVSSALEPGKSLVEGLEVTERRG